MVHCPCLQSHEVKQPYQKIVLGWITFLSVLALLPIPVYPLQHWWNQDDQVVCEVFKKPSSSKRTEMRSNKVSQLPAYALRRLTLRAQDKGGQVPLPRKNPTDDIPLQPLNLLTRSDSEIFSSFSLRGDSTVPNNPEAPKPTVLPAGGQSPGQKEQA